MKIPNKCKKCAYLWTHGIKDEKSNKWCCRYGKPTYKAIGHCTVIMGLLRIKVNNHL